MARELSSKGRRVGELSEELDQLQKAKEKLDQLNEELKQQLASRLPQGDDISRLREENDRLEEELRLTREERDQAADRARQAELEARWDGFLTSFDLFFFPRKMLVVRHLIFSYGKFS